ncbi:MAG: serine hydrolase [Planctomycetaceae bacterium]|nr:serine hydrolase [Planctomycetaceae bacterium]
MLGTSIVVGQPAALAERGNPRVEFDGQTIDAMVADFMEEQRIPGMTLAIVQAPYIPRVVGYGVSNVEKGLLASPKTLWNVGQMTQAYTAVAIMQLVEAGKLGIDDPIGKHVAGLPGEWQAISVRQLMAHASGLPDYTQQAGFDASRAYAPAAVIALVAEAPLAFRPGTAVANSATDFYLLGLAVEAASGMSYEAFVTENQIKRLGLKNTIFASDLPQVKQEAVEANGFKHKEFLRERDYIDPTEMATGYTVQSGKLTPAKQNAQSAFFANGAVLASAEDISLWDMGLAGELLVTKKENRDFLYAPVKLADGATAPAHCGWRFPGHRGLMDIQGNVPGFSCYLSRFTDKSELLCVTLCANKEGVDLSGLARRIAGAFIRTLGPPVGPRTMACRESCYSVAETVDRLEALVKSKGIDVAARVDHAAAAKKKGLELPPTEVLIFGNPAVGTQLMQSRRSVALDLPLRVAVWEEADGTVWTGYHDVAGLAAQHGIGDRDEVVAAMQAGLEALLRQATAPY